MAWDPAQYLAFSDHRLQPALDLMARIAVADPARIHDLGCGPGNVTALLARRWPAAAITGIDSSAEMLDRAATDFPDISWQQADIGQWQPEAPADLIFSNAALHWLRDHDRLFPALIDKLAPGGTLAVQMPNNFLRPTHRLVEQAAEALGLTGALAHLIAPPPVHSPGFYYDLLSPVTSSLAIWETDYLQPLAGDNPVADWTKGTWLRPFLDALEGPDAERLENEYRRRIAEAYPRQPDGRTLLPFKRIFLLATL